MGEDERGSSGDHERGVYTVEDIVRHGRWAYCDANDGNLYEHEEGEFWVTRLGRAAERRPVDSLEDVPFHPWRHSPHCDCPGCAGCG